jgi:hypothetical protein
MLYESLLYAEDEPGVDPDQLAVLMKIDKVNGQKVGASRYGRNTVPSAGDVAYIRKYCEYTGASHMRCPLTCLLQDPFEPRPAGTQQQPPP